METILAVLGVTAIAALTAVVVVGSVWVCLGMIKEIRK